jgi:phosphoribosylanthranilate isomerase
MLKLKVCGLTDPKNNNEVIKLKPDMIGFIFYEQSIRNIINKDLSDILMTIPKSIKKVGVFVDLDLESITHCLEKYNLDLIQLYHADINPFQELRSRVKIIKALSIKDKIDIEQTSNYFHLTDYFLFDTKGDKHGGNGIKFEWEILNSYQGDIPFFLSGGINVNDISALNKIDLPTFYGVDINSQFEIIPGIKNTELIKTFKTNLHAHEDIRHT